MSASSLASSSLSYSGRLVQPNGEPVSGMPNLRFDISSTFDPSDTLCSKTVNGVPLLQGIFSVELEFDPSECEGNTFDSIISSVPSGHTLTYQVTDTTNLRSYSVQTIHSVPYSYMANIAKSLGSMGASIDGQVLKWDVAGSKWVPGSVGSGDGTVTTINTGSGLAGGPISTTGTIYIPAGGVLDSHLAGAINPSKLDGARDGTMYLRGDNTWSNFRTDTFSLILAGFSEITGSAVTNTDTVINAFGKLQGQITDLESGKLDKTGGTLVVGTIDGVPTPSTPSQVVNKQYVDDQITNVNESQWTTSAPHIYYNTGNVGIGTSTPNEKLEVTGNAIISGKIRLKDSGTNFVELKAPSVTAGVTFTLPANAGTNGYVLKTDGFGVLSWGAMTIDSTSITDGSIVDADVSATAAIAQSKIANLTTDLAAKEPTITGGTTAQYWRGDKSWQDLEVAVRGTDLAGLSAGSGTVTATDTVLSALGKLAGNQGNYVEIAGDTMTGNLDMGGNTVTNLAAPVANSDAATKQYVDGFGQWTLNSGNVYRSTGNVGVGTSTLTSKLTVAGGVQIGSDAATCDTTKAGTLRYNATSVEYCNGSSWQAFGISGSGITSFNGSSQASQSLAVPGDTGTAPNWSTNTATGVHTLNIPMASASGVTAGLLSKTDYDVFNSKLGTSTFLSGDVSGTYNATSVDKIKGTPVSITTLTTNNLLKFDGTNWINSMLSASDIPSLDAGKITTGVLPVARGGTNTSSLFGNRIMVSTATSITEAAALTDGQLLIGSTGATPVPATLTAGTGVTITNSAGSITIAATGSGGTVTSVSGTAPISVATGTTTPAISISQASSTTDGYLSSVDWNTFNGKQSDLSAGATINGIVYPATNLQTLQIPLAPVNLTDAVNKAYVDSFGQWQTSSGNVYRTSGNVGVGTTSPAEKLDVSGKLLLQNGFSSDNGALVYKNDTDFLFIGPQSGTSTNGAIIGIRGTTNTSGAVAAGSLNLGSKNNPYAVLIEGTSGNVGIGTTSPGARFEAKVDTVQDTGLPTEIARFTANQTDGSPASRWLSIYSTAYNSNGNNMVGFGKNTSSDYGFLSNAGTRLLTIQNGGNVGIGTTSPSQPLHVKSSSSAVNGMILLENDTAAQTGLYTARSALSHANKGVLENSNGILINPSGGNVGIGTTAPNSTLSIGSNLGSGYAITANSTTSYGVNVQTSEASPSANPAFWVRTTPDNGTTVNTLFRVQNNGNVGVGTIAPGAKLDVLSPTDGSATALKLTSGDSGWVANQELRLDFNQNLSTVGRIAETYFNPDWGINFYGYNSGLNSSPIMTLRGSGNVGIGTTTPGYKLQVGNAADGSEARANAWNILSDERLKKNFKPIPDALEKLLGINGYFYYWNRGPDKSRKLGVKAQEVEKVFPEVVSEGPDGFKSVSYAHLIAPVIEGLKLLYGKVLALYERDLLQDQKIAAIEENLKVKDRIPASVEKQDQELRNEVSELKAKVKRIPEMEAENAALKAYLCQKDPAAPFCRGH